MGIPQGRFRLFSRLCSKPKQYNIQIELTGHAVCDTRKVCRRLCGQWATAHPGRSIAVRISEKSELKSPSLSLCLSPRPCSNSPPQFYSEFWPEPIYRRLAKVKHAVDSYSIQSSYLNVKLAITNPARIIRSSILHKPALVYRRE